MPKDKVKCMVCGKELGRVTALHLWKEHQMTMREYREEFPHADIVPENDNTTMDKVFQGYPTEK